MHTHTYYLNSVFMFMVIKVHRARDEQTLSGTSTAGELSAMSVITDKQAVIDKQLQEHYHCPAERSAATISVPPSHTFTHYPSVTHTHTHTHKVGKVTFQM